MMVNKRVGEVLSFGVDVGARYSRLNLSGACQLLNGAQFY